MYAFRCINKMASDVAGLPFLVGNAQSKTPRSTAPMARLLSPPPGGPNPVFSASLLWWYAIVQYRVLGKFAWLKERGDGGEVQGLWPLQAHLLVPVMSEPGSRAPSYFSGYEYGVRGSDGFRELPLSEVVYVWKPSVRDIRQPESPVLRAAQEINIMALLSQFDAAFLDNGGVPAHMVTTMPFPNQSERVAFRDQFRNKFGGVRNANRAMFMERNIEAGEVPGVRDVDPVTVTKVAESQKDAQLDVLRDSKIQDLCVAMGVPLSMLGDTTRSKFTNGAVDRKNYWENNAAVMRELADAVNLALGPDFGSQDVGWFDTATIPELATYKITEDMVKLKLATPDEYRQERGLPPMPVEAAPEPIAPPEPSPSEPPDKLPVKSPAGPDPLPKTMPLRASNQRTTLREVLRGQLDTLAQDQDRELRARLDGKRGGRWRAVAATNLRDAYDEPHWARRAVELLTPTLRAMGMDDGAIGGYAQAVTRFFGDRLDLGSWDLDGAVGLLEDQGTVPAAALQSAILAVGSGSVTAAAAFRRLAS
jgi:phage portal protein BeeE